MQFNEVINVKYVQFPSVEIHGASTINSDGSYTILLDPRDSSDVQRETYFHELEHITHGDFFDIDTKHVGAVENSAHEKDRGKS